MKAKTIAVSVKFTKNLGNYQSFAAEAAITVELEPGDTPREAYEESWSIVKEQVRKQIESLQIQGGL